MVAHYGSADAVKGLLGNDGDGAEVWTDVRESRIVDLLTTVSRIIETETGCIFGSSVAETIEIDADDGDSTLYLAKGIRSVTSIIENPATWSGTAWSNGTTLTTLDYRLSGKITRRISGDETSTVYRTLQRINGAWSGKYIITGVWEDQVPSVPDRITYAANYLAAEIFKKQKASPAGFVGPDNAVVPVRNTFSEPEIRKILDAWRIGAPLVFV